MRENRTQEPTPGPRSVVARLLTLAALALVAVPAAGQNRVIVIEEESLTVEPEKPEAFYILSPSNLDYQSVDPAASFLDELYETVEEALF